VVRTIGRYEVLQPLGEGGMAVVHLARQSDLQRFVALKELRALHGDDPAYAQRFLREARLAGSITDANVVTVYEYLEHDGTPYLAMEYLERGSLRRYVGHMNLPQISGVLEAVLAGLVSAEREGVVHRDLKPENVLVTADGRCKIADFGIAKATSAVNAGTFKTSTGMMIGTPVYMAPEQAMAQDVGPWTDLYSVGCMAFELFTGKRPFHEVDAPMAILMHHATSPIPRVEGIDPRIADWIERLLVKDPAQRTRSAEAAWDEYEELALELLGPRWRRDARLTHAPGERVPNEPTPTASPYTPPPPDLPPTPLSPTDAPPAPPFPTDALVPPPAETLDAAPTGPLAAAQPPAPPPPGSPPEAAAPADTPPPVDVPPSAAAPADTPPPAGSPPPSGASPPGSSPRRGRLGLLLGGAAAVVVVIVLAVVLLGGGSGGGDDSPSVPAGDTTASIPADNLTANPSFEQGLGGWTPFQGKLAREAAADAPDGSYVARVTAAEDGEQYAIDDEPDTLEGNAQAGHVYTAVAWVKAGQHTDNKPICLGVRNLDGGTAVAMIDADEDTWQRLQVTYTTAAAGSSLSVYVFRWADDVQHDESFLVDAITLAPTPGAAPDATVDEARCEA
jgi:serine/threonine protein kinase